MHKPEKVTSKVIKENLDPIRRFIIGEKIRKDVSLVFSWHGK